ncbi:hypothetical protein OB2597_03554 [Pseudooceanicola batsensis HTCC2597]|uniref:YIP1 family protein n=1 Tax=Pseudooceanicola batsensis (strain ATCC BAA-863 / DSM 15984 / KCTC 12145 / HTCC2597) TaxID=252305 RepID=A3U435_PSEBH|nr:hypothetical protein [Pseudooceanicola batsensis]EAQ01082.1 hypothetical protein OB2597_03554 [Pseudooceanicola batsensis HTCC2597]
MSVMGDIVRTYRGPGSVLRRRLSGGQREDRALAILMAGCGLLFVAQWPRLARESHESGTELNMLMGGALLALVFILPLILYALAGISHLVARLIGGRADHHSARMALFWALLAAGPVFLLNGLMQGFAGTGPQSALTGLLALGVFLWFWLAGLVAAERGRS